MIAIGADHGGYELKEEIKKYLDEKGIEYKDFGTYSPESVDYAAIAYKVGTSVVSGESTRAILCCGTGIGISMAANKVKGVRAACCSDYFSAKFTRLHNDANILCIGERVLGVGLALDLVDAFVNAEYMNSGNHVTRVAMLKDIEEGKLD